MYKIYIFLILAFLSNGSALKAGDVYQNSPIEKRDFEEQSWRKATKNLDYSGKATPNETEQNETSTGRRDRDAGQGQQQTAAPAPLFEGLPFMKYVFFAIAIAALVFLIWRIIRNAQATVKNPKVGKQQFSLEAEHIHELDFDFLLKNALQNNDFRLAIRIYYLMLIKKMADAQRIEWRKNKTNLTYLRELRGSSFYNDFQKATLLFERVWFGEQQLETVSFAEAKQYFEQLIKNI